jgi:hypothetical protein
MLLDIEKARIIKRMLTFMFEIMINLCYIGCDPNPLFYSLPPRVPFDNKISSQNVALFSGMFVI